MKAVTYVEIDVDYCSLTYGIPPCLAQLSYADGTDPNAAIFDDSYLKRGAGLTGAADSKSMTFAAWVKFNAMGSAQVLLSGVTALNGATYRVNFGVTSANKVKIELLNAAGSATCNIETTAAQADDDQWHLILASVDMTNTAHRHIVIDGVPQAITVTTYLDDVIDFTLADWGVGALPSGGSKLNGELANLWFQPGLYTDFSDAANVLDWRDIVGRPVDPTINQINPILFLGNAFDAFQTNLGTGGNFTVTGELTEGSFATGTKKCFNTRATCQSKPSFDNEPVTLRFAMPANYLSKSIPAIQALTNVSINPGTVSLGKDLGTRTSVNVGFADFKHSDVGPGYDKYWTERGFNPYDVGTYFGKFRSRQPFLRGEPMRVIRGFEGQTLEEMETYHFVIESFNGPNMDGAYSITAKDALKMVDGDRAQAPRLSNGYIGAAINSAVTTATLLPVGIGDQEYPTSGWGAIGGKEIVSFTRTGDSLVIVRAQYNTEAVAHDAQERFQLCLRYNAADPADIISDLFQTYAEVPSAYVDLPAWKLETESFYRRLMTTLIAEPTPVNKLISEIIEQAALAIWWDPQAMKIKLQVLRQLSTEGVRATTDRVFLQDTMQPNEQPDKRISQVWTYYAQANPLKGITDPDNFRSTAVTVDLEAEDDYGTPAIKKIFSRWIPAFGRVAATRVNAIQLGRFRDPPRQFTYSLFREQLTNAPQLGAGSIVEAWPLQMDTGERETVPVQIVRVLPDADSFKIEAEEIKFITFDEDDFNNRVIIIDGTNYNLNMRTIHDTLYPAPVAGISVTIIVEAGAKIGSLSTGLYALDTGDWPADVDLFLVNKGRIQGRGADGGSGAYVSGARHSASGGGQGGPALRVRVALSLDNTTGKIYGGGGGGGGAGILFLEQHKAGGGGGGSGLPAGNGGWSAYQYGSAGSEDAGGIGGSSYASWSQWQWPADTGVRGGYGGWPGSYGSSGSHHNGQAHEQQVGAGGPPGAAIQGASICTITAVGTIAGPQVG